MSELILTRLQALTVNRLKSSSWDEIKPSDVTRLLPKLLDSKPKSEELIPKIIKYTELKNPGKSIEWVIKALDKKIKSKSDKITFKEVLQNGDYSSFPAVDKPVKQVDNVLAPVNPKKKSGSDAILQQTLDKILSNENKTPVAPVAPAAPVVAPEAPAATGLDFGNLFKTGTKKYNDNKGLVDKFKASLTQKKIDDGSWFTSLASLEVPEIEMLQKLINITPLGLNSKDKDNLTALLSRDKSKIAGVSTKDGIKLILKTFVNPDAIGKIISTRGDQITADAAQSLDEFYRKVTGKPKEKDKNLGKLEDLVNQRINDQAAIDKRTKELDLLKGKTTVAPPKTPAKPGDIVGLKPGLIPGKFKPVNGAIVPDNQLSVANLLTPPPIPGVTETTAVEDFFSGLRNIFIPTFGLGRQNMTPAMALEWLRTNKPAVYNDYITSKSKYDRTVSKVALNPDSDIDLSVNKNELLRAREFTQKILKTASSLKQLTDDQIEQIYDISGTLEDVMSGKSKISYTDLDNITKSIINLVPTKTLKDTNLADFINQQRLNLGAAFNGDSTLTDLNTDGKYGSDIIDNAIDDRNPKDPNDPKDPKDPRNPKDPKPPDNPQNGNQIIENKLDDLNADEDPTWSELRPQMKWGDDDKFLRTRQNVSIGNLIADAFTIEKPGWGNGADNSLFLFNTEYDRRRYAKASYENQHRQVFNYPGQTQFMDSYRPDYPEEIPQKFPVTAVKINREDLVPYLTPAIPPCGLERRISNQLRNPAEFRQFEELTPRVPLYPGSLRNSEVSPAYYPDVQNLDYNRSNAKFTQNFKYNYIQNQRFLRR